ncbi:hypothetical protein Nepgr_011554 [Nepenthes gracilis]|uniref:RRM domain-containing protein n=1 Tax=Nepenthes gracilis TaxID=150966 RepID=A0AAD3SEK2_NEPGR|nr:hypothetical protein Nepgr_011554 [Nepenthes gracilis]
MPPKSSSAGRSRRATRSTARKSTGKSPFVKPCTEEAATVTNSSTDTTPNASSVVSSAEEETAVTVSAAATTASPLSIPTESPIKPFIGDSNIEAQVASPPPAQTVYVSTEVTTEPPIAMEPSNDAVSETQTGSKIAEGINEYLSAQAVVENDAVLASDETVGKPNLKTTSDANEGSLSPQPVRTTVEDPDVNVAVIRQEAVVEAASKDVGNSGGKGKKMVKKTVKVVKKVIKKVPKRVVKGEADDTKVDVSEKPDAHDDDPNLSGVNVENVKPPLSLGAKNSNADLSLSKEVEESNQDMDPLKRVPMGIVGSKNSSEAQNNKANISMEVDENDNSSSCQYGKDATEKVLSESFDKAGGRDAESENRYVDLGSGKGEVGGTDEVDNGDNAVKREDEVGEGMYFSGEMEAMERRKRRKTQIFIGGLDKDAKEEDIRKVFEEVGEVVELQLLMNGKTGKNKGYAFLRYASAVDAKRALEKFSKVEICGKQCGAAPVEGNDTIYLGNIDKKWKDENVAKLLQDMGIEKIDKVTVLTDPNNSECNRGFAFVELESSKDAQIAYNKLLKKDAFGKNQRIKVAWAEPLKELDEEEMLKVKTVYAEFIPLTWDEDTVRENFKKFGEIDNVVLARNLRSSKRKDFAFISYKAREAAIACIESFTREFQNNDGAKVNVKVSLAKPIPKGKQLKQVVKPVSKEVPTEKPQSILGKVRSVDLRDPGTLIMPHYYDSHRAERPSTNAELVQLLREQASWRQSQTGPVDVDYSNTLSGRKRPFSMMEANPPSSSLTGYARPLVDTSFPISGLRYGSLSSSGGTSSAASYQQHGGTGYTSRFLYGARDYPGHATRDEASGRSLSYRRF